jgi:hypothetical protein
MRGRHLLHGVATGGKDPVNWGGAARAAPSASAPRDRGPGGSDGASMAFNQFDDGEEIPAACYLSGGGGQSGSIDLTCDGAARTSKSGWADDEADDMFEDVPLSGVNGGATGPFGVGSGMTLSDVLAAAAMKDGGQRLLNGDFGTSALARATFGSLVVPRAVDLDEAAVSRLPAALQFEVLDEVKLAERTRRRDELVRADHSFSSFSLAQLDNYVEMSHVASRVDKLRASLNEQAQARKRIVGDAGREYFCTRTNSAGGGGGSEAGGGGAGGAAGGSAGGDAGAGGWGEGGAGDGGWEDGGEEGDSWGGSGGFMPEEDTGEWEDGQGVAAPGGAGTHGGSGGSDGCVTTWGGEDGREERFGSGADASMGGRVAGSGGGGHGEEEEELARAIAFSMENAAAVRRREGKRPMVQPTQASAQGTPSGSTYVGGFQQATGLDHTGAGGFANETEPEDYSNAGGFFVPDGEGSSDDDPELAMAKAASMMPSSPDRQGGAGEASTHTLMGGAGCAHHGALAVQRPSATGAATASAAGAASAIADTEAHGLPPQSVSTGPAAPKEASLGEPWSPAADAPTAPSPTAAPPLAAPLAAPTLASRSVALEYHLGDLSSASDDDLFGQAAFHLAQPKAAAKDAPSPARNILAAGTTTRPQRGASAAAPVEIDGEFSYPAGDSADAPYDLDEAGDTAQAPYVVDSDQEMRDGSEGGDAAGEWAEGWEASWQGEMGGGDADTGWGGAIVPLGGGTANGLTVDPARPQSSAWRMEQKLRMMRAFRASAGTDAPARRSPAPGGNGPPAWSPAPAADSAGAPSAARWYTERESDDVYDGVESTHCNTLPLQLATRPSLPREGTPPPRPDALALAPPREQRVIRLATDVSVPEGITASVARDGSIPEGGTASAARARSMVTEGGMAGAALALAERRPDHEPLLQPPTGDDGVRSHDSGPALTACAHAAFPAQGMAGSVGDGEWAGDEGAMADEDRDGMPGGDEEGMESSAADGASAGEGMRIAERGGDGAVAADGLVAPVPSEHEDSDAGSEPDSPISRSIAARDAAAKRLVSVAAQDPAAVTSEAASSGAGSAVAARLAPRACSSAQHPDAPMGSGSQGGASRCGEQPAGGAGSGMPPPSMPPPPMPPPPVMPPPSRAPSGKAPMSRAEMLAENESEAAMLREMQRKQARGMQAGVGGGEEGKGEAASPVALPACVSPSRAVCMSACMSGCVYLVYVAVC